MEKTIRKSQEYFNSGFGCAESVLMAVTESKGIKSDLIPRIATGFCGGVANTNGMCGAVIGGIMAINIIYGRDKADGLKDINYKKVQEFFLHFDSKFGCTNCKDLTGCDLATEEGQNLFKEMNIHDKCNDFTGEATRIVLGLL